MSDREGAFDPIARELRERRPQELLQRVRRTVPAHTVLAEPHIVLEVGIVPAAGKVGEGTGLPCNRAARAHSTAPKGDHNKVPAGPNQAAVGGHNKAPLQDRAASNPEGVRRSHGEVDPSLAVRGGIHPTAGHDHGFGRDHASGNGCETLSGSASESVVVSPEFLICSAISIWISAICPSTCSGSGSCSGCDSCFSTVSFSFQDSYSAPFLSSSFLRPVPDLRCVLSLVLLLPRLRLLAPAPAADRQPIRFQAP